jgi:photosystem II stability/assembly factor-like uncharacterized protein
VKNAADSRVSRRLLLVGLVSVTLTASRVSAGVNVWTTNGPTGQDIRALAINPANPTTLYAGTHGSGIFKSTDSGRTWVAANTALTNRYIHALALDPSTPAKIYAGTDDGVFKFIDSGGTWVGASTGLGDPHIYALAIDSRTPTTLYAGSYGGVFKSTDSGGTWAGVNTGLGSPYIDALAVDPANPGTLYAGTVGPQVFKSTDSGGTWAYTGAGPNDPWGYGDVFDLAIDPANPATLYAVFKSIDSGRTWTVLNTGLSYPGVRTLAIGPVNSATIYGGTSVGVFRSTDSGETWAPMNAGLTNLTVNALAIDPSTPARIYAATDGGVYEYETTELPIDRRILPVVGSTPGANGTFFRTSVQLNNPGSAPMSGRIVFHPSGAAGRDADPGLSYSLAPGQTQSIADLLPAMGRSGLGSADIEITSGGVPVATARVFNDAGPSGTTGFTEGAMREDEALRPGQTGVLLIPPDFTVARFNVGVRTLEGGASATFTLRNASGAVIGSNTRAFPPDYHEQRDAVGFLGIVEVPPGGSVSITVNSGAAIVYGATVDNRTGDSSLQIARATP